MKASGKYDLYSDERRHKHWTKLSEIAEPIIDLLQKIHFSDWNEDYLVADYLIEGEDTELISKVDSVIATGLLQHLRAEYKAFPVWEHWGSFQIKDVTKGLIDELSLSAERGIFKGTCIVCEDWPEVVEQTKPLVP